MILRVVIVAELIGTALLAFVFVPAFGWGEGLWQALFHSVSAFNNAGFSLFPDSLSAWATNPLVNLVVPAAPHRRRDRLCRAWRTSPGSGAGAC